MREIVDKVRTQHLRTLQLGCHLVEAVRQLYGYRVSGQQAIERQPCFKVTGGEAVEGIDDAVHRSERISADRSRKDRSGHNADQRYNGEKAFRFRRALSDLEYARLHQQNDRDHDQQHGHGQKRKHQSGKEQRQRKTLFSFFRFLHMCFTAL